MFYHQLGEQGRSMSMVDFVEDKAINMLEKYYAKNLYVDEKIIHEANVAKARNVNDYNHIWLGYPLSNNNEFLLSSETIDKAINLEYEADSSYFSNS